MSGIGETLRRERLHRKLTLGQISQELKINVGYLEAIEVEGFDRLPAPIFAKSFVRQYARLLDLDADEMAAEVQRTIEPPAGENVPAEQARTDEPSAREVTAGVLGFQARWVPAAGIGALAIALAFAAFSAWQRYGRVAPVRDTASAHAAARVKSGADSRLLAVSGDSAPAGPALGTADRVAAPLPQTAASGEAGPHLDAPLLVSLQAAEPVWVRATADGKYVFAGTLEPEQTRTIEASGAVDLLLGNAGGVSVSLNGKPIGPLGVKGQVRTIQLTSGGFTIRPPKASSADPL